MDWELGNDPLRTPPHLYFLYIELQQNFETDKPNMEIIEGGMKARSVHSHGEMVALDDALVAVTELDICVKNKNDQDPSRSRSNHEVRWRATFGRLVIKSPFHPPKLLLLYIR